MAATNVGGEEADAGAGGRVPLLHMFFTFADRKDVALMAVGSVAAIAKGVAAPLMALLFGDLVDAFAYSSRSSLLHAASKIAVNFLYIAIFTGGSSFLHVSCWTSTSERQIARIRTLYLKAILKQDMSFFDTQESASTGQLVTSMSADTVFIQEAIGQKAGRFIQLMSTFLIGSVLALSRGWILTLVVMTSVPPMFIILLLLSRAISVLSVHVQAANGEVGSVIEQTVGDIKTVASFGGESKAAEKYSKTIVAFYKSEVYMDAVIGCVGGFIQFVLFSSCGLAVWYGSTLIIKKGFSAGTVVSVMTIIMNATPALVDTLPCVRSMASGQAMAYRIFKTIHRLPKIDVDDKKGLVLCKIRGDVELCDVSFSYPARPGHLVFDCLSLRFQASTVTALVGRSGSGKSTVINLLQRFYDPDSGQIVLDGVDLTLLKLYWLRAQIGLVSQEPALFTSTIRENLLYGKKDATEEEMRKALQLANAWGFIDQLPEGLDTRVGEHAKHMSGGQKQRIAIARAILNDPNILILDEATSALDMESEKTVLEALEKIMVGRTTIIVSHRLSTVRNADTIAVLQHGKLVEHGSHAELTSDSNGEYSKLICLQEKLQTAAQSQTRDLEDRSSSSCRPSPQAEGLDENSSFDLLSPLLDQPERGAAETSSLKELLGRLIGKTDMLLIVVGCVASAARGALLPAFGLAIAYSISSFHKPPSMLAEHATFNGAMFVALGAAALVLSPAKQCIFGIAGTRLVQHVRCYTFHKVVHQEIGWFDDPSNASGAISARLTEDASSIKNLIGDGLALVVEDTAILLAAFAISMATNWKLALIVSSFLPCVLLEGYAEMNFISATFKAAKERYEEASNIASDAIINIRSVASLCAQKKMVETYECKCQALKALGIRHGITSAIGYGLSTMIVNSFHGACFFFGAKLVHDGNATIDQVFTVYLALSIAASSVSQSYFQITPLLSKAKEAAGSMRRILDRESQIDAGSTAGMILPHATVKGEMSLRNVRFRYPMRRHVEVLRGLCLTIPSCQTVALVGKSGSGKSTIIALLQRFYDPDHGTVTFDGVDLRSLKVSWLRQQIGLVAQEPALFDDTIWENIAYGARAGAGVSREEVVAAAEVAGAHGFISSLPCGYDTRVGPHGVRLSGGQKQRVAIARVALRDPRVLLLDEATSALDSESEWAVVQGVLGRLVMDGKRTCVVVAHRLATVVRADKIAVLKDGVIAEQGQHDDLLRHNGGIYASIMTAN